MRILVFIKEVPDIKIPLEYDGQFRGLRPEGQVKQLNPPDRAALNASLRIKEHLFETHITVIHLGGVSGERWIREGIALGCDEGLRIWFDEIDELHAPGKALIFSRIAEILGFDLILTGTKGFDTASGHVGILMACRLGVPHVNSVVEVELKWKDRNLIVRKRLDRGFQERIQCRLPSVISVEAKDGFEKSASFTALLDATEKDIPCWNLAQIGIPREHVIQADSLLRFGSLRFPQPRLQILPAPDVLLPTFERIKKLLEGTIQRREGRVLKQDEDRLVDELFQTLLDEGWLNHLRKE